MPRKPKPSQAQRDAIHAHVAQVRGLDGREREALALLLIDPGPAVDLPEFFQADAASRYGTDPPGFPEPDTRWFSALMQKAQGITPHTSDVNGPAVQLTAEQRSELLMRHAFARFMVHTLLGRCGMRPGDAEQCRDVLAWHARALTLMHRLADFEMKLIVWCAGMYKRSPLDLAERISICGVALLRAIERYDPRRGAFSTCATRYMRSAMWKTLQKHNRHAAGTIHETDCGGCADSPGLLASAPGSESLPDDLHLDLAGFLAEPGLLTPAERRVLAARYGVSLGSDLDDATGEPLTLEQVGRMIGVTRERVRQIETVALEKLRCRFSGLPIPSNPGHLIARARQRKRGQLDGPDPLQEIAPIERENTTIGHKHSTI